ncbi:MAG: phosphoribosylanthranilate isomerase [Clostridiales bacterium]|nr:phosphoribosylanthranilate isomerase [Clostridiales bacterium]
MSGAKIKICGLFRPCDAQSVNDAMPDYAGFVFDDRSRRYVAPQQAHRLREAICPGIVTVGVFVDAPQERIAALYRAQVIGVVQLHGGEGDGDIARLREALCGVEIWQAYKIRSAADRRAAEQSTADRVLLDSGSGSGRRFDWSLIEGFARPFVLAGGLTPETIPEAIARLHPDVVDISSGVESGGVKDPGKMLSAVAAARGP